MAARARARCWPLIALGVAGLLLAAGLAAPQLTPALPPAVAFPAGVLRVGVDASFPPFALDEGGTLAGVDIDLGQAIAAYHGLPVRFVPISFDALYDALLTDQVDVLISALLVNPLRTQDVRYTRPYFDNGLRLVSPAAAPLPGMAALPGLRLAYEFGGTADNEARAWLRRVDDFALRPYELPQIALDALRVGAADAALVDATTLALYLRQQPGWPVQAVPVTHVFYAAAVRLDRPATFAAVDGALAALAADGTLAHILRKWL
ncbi:MAG: ABC transporter substrate-binding protein [Anaerolineae bacterium]|nr:ABC transporter substrate-binding protein [Anaerolineae bacterium]